jgi:hypothetical protein
MAFSNPNSVTGSGTTTLNVTTSLATPVGSYQLNIIGSVGGLSHSVTVTLGVGISGISLKAHAHHTT